MSYCSTLEWNGISQEEADSDIHRHMEMYTLWSSSVCMKTYMSPTFLTHDSSPPPTLQQTPWTFTTSMSLCSHLVHRSCLWQLLLSSLDEPNSYSRKWIKVQLCFVKPSLAPCLLSYLHFFALLLLQHLSLCCKDLFVSALDCEPMRKHVC